MRLVKKFLNVSDLAEGMILAKNIEQNGTILLNKDLVITESIIEKLRYTFFWGQIEVYVDEDNLNVKKKNETLLYSKQIEEKFNELSINLQEVFEQISNISGRFQLSSIKEIREFAKKIQDELNSTSIIIKNIVLYGSGQDIIYRHGVNVAALSAILGQWIGMNQKELNLLVYSAMLHDFGKVKIDKKILDKTEKLTNQEFQIIKKHPGIGYEFLKDVSFLDKSVSYGVLMHHERIDGSGYPLGLTEPNIHKFAKIIAIADVFDAINSSRKYRMKKMPFEAMQIVKEESFGKLSYEYSKIFLEHISNYYIGEQVLLNTGEVCKIIHIDINNLEKPLLLNDEKFIDLSKEKDVYIKEMLV